MEIDPALNSDESVCIDDYESNSVQSQPPDADNPSMMEYCPKKQPIIASHFENWIGCAAHQLQLVVHAELLDYQRVQVVFNKAKAICRLSHMTIY